MELADALSRLPCVQCGRSEHFTNDDIVNVLAVDIRRSLGGHNPEEIHRLQLEDNIIGPVLRAVEKNEKPLPAQIKTMCPESRRLFQQFDQLKIKDSQLYRRFHDPKDPRESGEHLQLVVPNVLKKDLLQELHAGVASGHLGEEKTMSRLRERFYWPGQWNAVQDWCRTCAVCATFPCLFPLRCSIVKLYSCKRSNHRASCPSGFLKFWSHFNEP